MLNYSFLSSCDFLMIIKRHIYNNIYNHKNTWAIFLLQCGLIWLPDSVPEWIQNGFSKDKRMFVRLVRFKNVELGMPGID